MVRYRGVILDVDCTLVDSNDAHARAWIAAMAEHGFKIPFEAVRKLIGMGGDKLLAAVIGVTDNGPVGKAISELRRRIFLREHLQKVLPTPGAEDLLAELKGRGFKLGVASSATMEELEPLLRRCNAGRYIHAKTSSDDADNSKPDPDIVVAALAELEVSANEAIMIGDTPYGVQAAKNACVEIIALRCGRWNDGHFDDALAVYDDPAHLLREFERSPLG